MKKKTDLIAYLQKQLNCFFPDGIEHQSEIESIIDEVMTRMGYCLSKTILPHLTLPEDSLLNHLNADQYTMFLYFASNSAYKNGYGTLANKLFYLNKSLHSFHCMYDTKLPDIFLVIHGVGTVVGKGQFSNYLVLTQGCTIGANADWQYPIIGEKVVMYPGSSVLGKTEIGSGVTIANNITVLNSNIQENSLVVGSYPNTMVKKRKKDHSGIFFRTE